MMAVLFIFIFILMPLVYLGQHLKAVYGDNGMPWVFTFAAIGFIIVIFFLRNNVTKVEIDKDAGLISIYHIRLFKTKVTTFSIADSEVSFTFIPGPRGRRTKVLRFKDSKRKFDMEFGRNGWSREVLEQIRTEISA